VLHILVLPELDRPIRNDRKLLAATVLHGTSLLLSVLLLLFYQSFYRGNGWLAYVIIYAMLPVLSDVSMILLRGYYRMYYSTMVALQNVLIIYCCIQSGVLSFKQNVFYIGFVNIAFTVFYVYQYKVYSLDESRPNRAALVAYLVLLYLSSFFALVNNYIHLESEVASFNNINLGASTAAKIRDFVNRLLPVHVQDAVGTDNLVGETAEDVTLLFADIVGFTAYSADKSPQEVVNMLSQLFTAFDKECSRLNLYKVYTIGDCYVVMSFLDKNNRQPPEKECVDVVELGFKMIEIIGRVREEVDFDGLHMRIGIHTGKIIGGVIGTGIIRYDLYGHDVLIANKMESSGQQDKVHISQATKEMIERSSQQRRYNFIEDDDVEIQALQTTVKTYFLEKI
jgi:class 3 adenylate cyclase